MRRSAGSERRQRSDEIGVVDGVRLRLARRRLERDHARAQPLVARAPTALGDREVAQDAAEPGAAVRAGLVAMTRGDGAREGLLHEVVGVVAGRPATGEALQEARVWVQLGGELG